jgi:hypothetical protein
LKQKETHDGAPASSRAGDSSSLPATTDEDVERSLEAMLRIAARESCRQG